ncbi:MAG: OmpH family outer membrane protein [Rikenellaceae bacterium]
MKKILKLTLFVAFSFVVSSVSAQKLGRVNVEELLMSMPEITQMQSDLEVLRKDYSNNLETMQVELNNKLADYQKNESTMIESVRALKEKEMQDLNQRMQQFEQSAVQELQAKQNQMIEPILAKARAAVAEVAKEGGYTAVFDESAGALAYYDDSVVNLLSAAKAKLGIK